MFVHVFLLQVSAGNRHTLLRSSTGEVYGCGSAESGQLGPASSDTVVVPQRIRLPTGPGQSGATLAVAAGDHSVAACSVAPAALPAPPGVQTCNTPLTIPDLMSLAQDARRDSAPSDERAVRVRALVEAVQNIFCNPGVLIAGFSLPPARRASQALDSDDAPAIPPPHGLDTDAIAAVFEAILKVLDSDVVLALRSTVTELLQKIEAREEAAHRAGTVSLLAQAQWLKVRPQH